MAPRQADGETEQNGCEAEERAPGTNEHAGAEFAPCRGRQEQLEHRQWQNSRRAEQAPLRHRSTDVRRGANSDTSGDGKGGRRRRCNADGEDTGHAPSTLLGTQDRARVLEAV